MFFKVATPFALVLSGSFKSMTNMAGHAMLLHELQAHADRVQPDDMGVTADAMYHHANSSIRPCLISDFPGCAVTTNALHIGQQVDKKRIGAERGRVADK